MQQVDQKVEIKNWPSIAGFRTWKLAFKKSVSSCSRRAKLAYKWLSEVEKAKGIDELEDSGDFEELDAKLSTALDGILQGEFKRKVQVKETELSLKGIPLTGRQITWMLYDYFKVSSNIDEFQIKII